MIKKLIKEAVYPIIKSPPDFLIIGAQKAGTTSLYRYLAQHPQVLENNTWKEIRYFDLPENYSQGLGWYLGHFPSKFRKGNKLTCDASPSYLYFPQIPKQIKQNLGNIKMIAVLREPVSRAYSAWQMYHSFSDNPNDKLKAIADERSFAEAIEQELNPESNTAKYPYDYIDRGKYVEQLENYYNYFDRDNILVLNIEQFRKNFGTVLDCVCDFLNIEKFSQNEIDNLNNQKHNSGKYKSSKTTEDQEKMEFLRSYFAPFNERLYTLLGTRYNWQ
ncbi:MAG: sulfotransferase domain-containing protein [Coleofasciculus chthonoplastes F3-SA18-01]|uniref:sulfotransferase domain-containing protein n=1 Tax=Coleofasciculus chthonoplastes TaxID=64178 RepID=UPI0032FCF6CB